MFFGMSPVFNKFPNSYQKSSKNGPKIHQKSIKNAYKNQSKTDVEKTTKNVRKRCPRGYQNEPKIHQKMIPRLPPRPSWTPGGAQVPQGAQNGPKSFQKSSKNVPKFIKKPFTNMCKKALNISKLSERSIEKIHSKA